MISLPNPLRIFSALGLAAVLATGVLASASVANAQATVAILHSFTPARDGATPEAGLIQGPDGTLYGTTYDGGLLSCGAIGCAVFQLASDGSNFTVLHTFTGIDGGGPTAGLIQGPDGTLYGTTDSGGASNAGVVFQLILSPGASTTGRLGHK